MTLVVGHVTRLVFGHFYSNAMVIQSSRYIVQIFHVVDMLVFFIENSHTSAACQNKKSD